MHLLLSPCWLFLLPSRGSFRRHCLQQIKDTEALKRGLVDAVVAKEDLLQAAKKVCALSPACLCTCI